MKHFLFIISFVCVSFVYSHSVQVGYCLDCNGNLTIWVEHWHGTEDPSTTTMSLEYTVGGVTTALTSSPGGPVYNTAFTDLPGCSTPITIFGTCTDANTYNDWVRYTFPGLPTNTPITVTIISGNTVFTQDGCGMYPASTGMIIITDPPTYPNLLSCGGPGNTIPTVIASGSNTWTNSNPGIGLPANGTGSVPSFTPNPSTTTQVANIHMANSCGFTDYQIIIYPSPDAVFSAQGGNQVCFDDQPITFSNSSSPPPTETLTAFLWDFGDGNTSSSNNPNHSYASSGTYTVSLEVTSSAHGCKGTLDQVIVVSPMPVADFITDSVCPNSILTIQDNSSINPVDGNQITSWNWDYGNGQTGTGSSPTPQPQYTGEGEYDITLVVTSNNGCTNSITKVGIIYPQPNVDFSFTDVCLNFPSVFTDLSTISNAHTINSNTVWNWDFGDGNTSSQQNPSHTYLADGSYQVNLEVTSNHGCTDNLMQTVTVFPLPIADFTFINACDKDSIEMNSTATTQASGFSDYFWDYTTDGSIDTFGTSIKQVYPNDGFYSLSHIVVDNNGCRDTIAQQITVYTLPVADFIVDAVCEDSLNTFINTSTITPVDGGTITNYEWDFGNGNTTTQENPTESYGIENIYNTQLIVTTNFGCKDTIIKPVTVYPLPHVDFSPTEVCLNFATVFEDNSTVSNAHTSNSKVAWNWDFGDGGASTQQNPTYTYATEGVYPANLSVITNNGCENDTTIDVIVYPLPEVSFVGQNLDGCYLVCPQVTSTTTIDNSAMNGHNSIIDSQTWTISNGNIYSGASFNDCYLNQTGQDQYFNTTLKVVSDKGCVSSLSKNNYIAVYHKPIARFYFTPREPGIEKPDIIHPDVQFYNTSSYANYYNWTFSESPNIISSDIDPMISFPETPETYNPRLIAFTDKGCSDTAWASVRIWDRILLYVPNTFTPDQDNFNETFKPVFTSGFDPQDFTLYVFNRYGELIFESHNSEIGWDGTYGGKIAQGGTYIWKIIFKESETDKHHRLDGHINLLR